MHRRIHRAIGATLLLAGMLVPAAKAQLWTWNKEQMMDYTRAWTGDVFPILAVLAEYRPELSVLAVHRVFQNTSLPDRNCAFMPLAMAPATFARCAADQYSS